MAESRFPPAYPSPLARQKAMATARAQESLKPEDSMSSAGSVAGSTASWSILGEGQGGGSAQPHRSEQSNDQKGATIPEHDPWQEPDEEDVPPNDPQVKAADNAPASGWSASGTAPATQAAKKVLDSKQKQSTKLAQQKARAKQRGHKGVRWTPMSVGGAQNAQNFQLPPFVQQLGSGEEERSVLIVDSRDCRLQSPFQGWLLDEILVNAQSGINVLVDRQLVRAPNVGYHMNLFYMRTHDGYKFILVGSMTSYGSVPCANWDADTGSVLSHAAFQPFRWPMMTNDSSIWVDVKVKVEGNLLLHLELRGYRSDQDMTVQLNYLNDALVMSLKEVLFVPACVVTIFTGWRVVATSFEVGGRIYACSNGGKVVALDFPLCHFEVRMTGMSSQDSIVMDADRLEFRFRSASDKVDVACSQVTVPSTWLVLSRVSGPTLIQNARWCRERQARVEGPDQTMQMSQLAGIHAHWTAATEATGIEDTGPRIGAVAVESHPSNVHLTCEAPLLKAPIWS